MAKTYERAPDEVEERAERLINLYHTDLELAGVRIDFIFATNDDGTAVTHHGYPALALCRVVSLKDRAKKMGDAEIVIDGVAYDAMSDAQKDGLLDHELEHLIVVRDKDGEIATDDLYRPKLKLKKHDWQMGWFTNIAQRHGMNSPEVYQAKILWDNDGQAFFPMLMEAGSDPQREIDVKPVVKAARKFHESLKKVGATVVIQ